eukprot:2744353-Pyramimonas_sp.AAC.1
MRWGDWQGDRVEPPPGVRCAPFGLSSSLAPSLPFPPPRPRGVRGPGGRFGERAVDLPVAGRPRQ